MSLPLLCHPFFVVLCHLLSSRRYGYPCSRGGELSSYVSSPGRVRASGPDWGLHPCTPFSPGAVVNAGVGIPQQIPQDQRCLARPDAYGAVGDDAALGDHSAVLEELPQLCRVLECAVGCAQKVGVQMHGAGDVARATCACRGARWPEALSGEFSVRTHIKDDRVPATEGALQRIQRHELCGLRFWERVCGCHRFGAIRRPGPTRVAPAFPRSMQHQRTLVTVGLHEPEAKRGTVTVEDDRGVGRETGSAQQILELSAVQRAVIRMVEIGVGVPEDGSRDVALFVCRPADVNLDNANIRIVEVLRKPCWFREHVRKRRTASPDRNAVCQFNLPPYIAGLMF